MQLFEKNDTYWNTFSIETASICIGITLVITSETLFKHGLSINVNKDRDRQKLLSFICLVGAINCCFYYGLSQTRLSTLLAIMSGLIVQFAGQFGVIIIFHNSIVRLMTSSPRNAKKLRRKRYKNFFVTLYFYPILCLAPTYYAIYYFINNNNNIPSSDTYLLRIQRGISLLNILVMEIFATVTDVILMNSVNKVLKDSYLSAEEDNFEPPLQTYPMDFHLPSNEFPDSGTIESVIPLAVEYDANSEVYGSASTMPKTFSAPELNKQLSVHDLQRIAKMNSTVLQYKWNTSEDYLLPIHKPNFTSKKKEVNFRHTHEENSESEIIVSSDCGVSRASSSKQSKNYISMISQEPSLGKLSNKLRNAHRSLHKGLPNALHLNYYMIWLTMALDFVVKVLIMTGYNFRIDGITTILMIALRGRTNLEFGLNLEKIFGRKSLVE
ncbi:hypothetical protein HDU92_003397 [Lobulomyces angularis]|nr:hypothetical protein HDU92_003397 [Lobulomyces angularis]